MDEVKEESRSHDCPVGGISIKVLSQEEAEKEDAKEEKMDNDSLRQPSPYKDVLSITTGGTDAQISETIISDEQGEENRLLTDEEILNAYADGYTQGQETKAGTTKISRENNAGWLGKKAVALAQLAKYQKFEQAGVKKVEATPTEEVMGRKVRCPRCGRFVSTTPCMCEMKHLNEECVTIGRTSSTRGFLFCKKGHIVWLFI